MFRVLLLFSLKWLFWVFKVVLPEMAIHTAMILLPEICVFTVLTVLTVLSVFTDMAAPIATAAAFTCSHCYGFSYWLL